MYNMIIVNCTECGWVGSVPEEDKAILKHSGCPICHNTNLTMTYKQADSDAILDKDEIKEIGTEEQEAIAQITVEIMKESIRKYGEKQIVKSFNTLGEGNYKRAVKRIMGKAIHELENEIGG